MRKTILIISILFMVGLVGIVNAQQVLPKGGDSFETAVKLEPGSYEGGSLDNKEAEYFYITGIKSGQEINIEATFTAADVEIGAWAILALYDKNGAGLAGEENGFYDEPLSLTISQVHRGKDSDKYYIMAKCDTWEISSHTLEISLVGEGDEGTIPAGQEGGEETGEKGTNWGLIIGIIIGVVILAIVLYFLLRKKKQ